VVFDGRIISGISVFVAVAEAGNYARASKQLGLSRSGVGKAVTRLEYRTGIRLFDRTTRAIKLTAEGREFLHAVEPLLERLGEVAAPRDQGEIRGHLRVNCDAAFGTYLLIPALPGLVDQHPHLKIDLFVRDKIESLATDGIDVAVRFGELDYRDLEKKLLFKSRVITCASRDYIRRHGMPTTPEELHAKHRCIRLIDGLTGKPHVWTFVNRAGERCEISPDCNITLNDAPSLMAGIRSGYGIGRALDFMVREALQTKELVEVLPEWNEFYWPAYIYTPAQAHLSAAVQVFTTFVLSHSFEQAPIRRKAKVAPQSKSTA
jgi:DNA-binding transcriptional LysR family regulator